MKKVILGIVVLAVVVLGFWAMPEAADTPKEAAEAGELAIASSIFPTYDLLRTVAGEHARVELVLEPGTSPHTFDPSPSTLRKLQGVNRFYAIGGGVDSWIDGIVENIPGATVMSLEKAVSLRESSHGDDHDEEKHEEHKDEHGHDDHADEHEEDHHEEDGHGHDDHKEESHDDHNEEEHDDEDHHGHHHHDHEAYGFDPHYWLDPENAVRMAVAIAEDLAQIDPAHADEYRANAQAFSEEMISQEGEWKAALADLRTRKLVTFHDAFYYFAEHFGLEVVATFEAFPGKVPTARYLQSLQEKLNTHGIDALFIEPQLDPAALEQFAADNQTSVGVLDPIGGVEGRESYTALIDFNVKAVAEALK